MSYSRIIATTDQGNLLESDQLARLEQSFRNWATGAGKARAVSRKRILLIFLLIRYTGAKLSEVLRLRVPEDVAFKPPTVCFRNEPGEETREVPVPESLAEEMEAFLRMAVNGTAEEFSEGQSAARLMPFEVDPAFVRRKFYERAHESGLEPARCGPEMVRKARSLELLRDNVPLPVVQHMLGHSSPNLTTSNLTFSEEDMRKVALWHLERESGRKTSARNSFFGKVDAVLKGDVQSLVELLTAEGERIRTVVTNSSADRLGLKPGLLASAEIKAPWLVLEPCERAGSSSADNMCEGVISKIVKGKVNLECEVEIHKGMTLCAVTSTPGFMRLGLKEGDAVRVFFSAYAVILHVD